jgi:hypothetical protein
VPIEELKKEFTYFLKEKDKEFREEGIPEVEKD